MCERPVSMVLLFSPTKIAPVTRWLRTWVTDTAGGKASSCYLIMSKVLSEVAIFPVAVLASRMTSGVFVGD